MHTSAALFVSLLLSCSSKQTTSPSNPSAVCVPSDTSTWAACEGRHMAVAGQVATEVRNHPMMNSPKTRQLYLDIGDLQIIVVTADLTECSGAMTAEGTLEVVDLGGAPGTMGSYRGLLVRDAVLACK